MWPVVIGIGIVALISEVFSEEKKIQPSRNRRKKIFISFAVEDEKYRDYLVNQAKSEKSPFDFIDMSVKRPWSENEWRERCRTKIKRCDGMIVLLSKNTFHASGARWEIKCAKEEKIPVIGMHIKKNDRGPIPPELRDKKVITWTWKNLDSTIKSMENSK